MRSGRFSGDELESEDRENSLSPSGDSPPSTGDFKASQKKRKATQKKVVSIPIKDLDLSPRTKGEASPPSDSWAWRKYGQKPIKGSPYPRGYYRCSSSKGCPARKQVERSRVDPTMLVVTYSSEHNHPSPPSSRTHHHHHPSPRGDIRHSPSSAATDGGVSPDVRDPVGSDEFNKFANLNDDFHGWFADMSYATMLDGPMLAETSADDPYATMLLPIMGEGEDQEESFFADLGELPECSMVFRRRGDMMTAAAGGSSGGARWCGAAS